MKRNITLLGIVSFLNDLSSEIIHPLLPFFLKSMNATALGIGIVGGLLDGFGNVVKLFSGYISDIFRKRKPLVFFGYLLSQVSKLGIGISSSAGEVSGFVIMDRIGKGIRTSPRDAIIAESSKERGKAFGFHRAMDTAGAVVGTLIAILLYESLKNFQTPILVAAAIGFFAVIPIFFVRDTGEFVPKKVEIGVKLKKYLFVAFLSGLCHLSYMFFLIRASVISVEAAFLLYLLFNVVYSLYSYPAGILADRFGKAKIVGFSYLIFSMSLLLMTFQNPLFFVVAFILYGIFMSVSEAQQRALASDLSKSQGFGLGAYHLSFGMAIVIGNIIAGALAELFTLDAAFVFASILSLISVFVYLFVKF